MRLEPEDLTTIPLFASFSAEELEAMASLFEDRDEPAGSPLVGEGSPGYSLFVLRQGEATVTREGKQVRKLRAGDFFGEIALLKGGEHTATVTASTPVNLLVMYGSDFRVFERDWPRASALMRKTMTERLARSGLHDL